MSIISIQKSKKILHPLKPISRKDRKGARMQSQITNHQFKIQKLACRKAWFKFKTDF
jgi:hypothetical protein